jgi:hypothetical protein
MIETIPSKLYWLLGLFLCLVIAWGFYRKDFFLDAEKPVVKWGLIGLRTISLFIVFFLLLDPFVSYQEKHELKPELLMLVDNSLSMKLGGISSDSLNTKLLAFKKELSPNINLNVKKFGERFNEIDTLSLSESKTDFQKALNEASNLFDGRNLIGAVIISDGIVNSGSKRNLHELLNAPIHSLAVGDTMLKKDLVLKHLYHNDKVILNNQIAVRVEGFARGFRGSELMLEFFMGKKKVGEDKIHLRKDEHQFTIEKKITADSVGLRKLSVRIVKKGDEFTHVNNELVSFINVLKQKKKIHILFSEPHPDIAAFKSSIAGLETYEVSTSMFENYDWSDSPSLIALFGMPIAKTDFQFVERKLQRSSANHLYFMNANVNQEWMSSSEFKVKKSGRSNDVQFSFNPSFSLFKVSTELVDKISSFPPLNTPYGEYVFARDYRVLGVQRIGKVNTEFPLICFKSGQGKRKAVVIGEGIWRWRLHELKESLTSEAEMFDELFRKTIKYLTMDFDSDEIQLEVKNVYELGEKIQLKAVVENSIKEQVGNLKLSVLVEGERDTLILVMNELNDAYQLELGKLSPGEYKVTLSCMLDEKKLRTTKKIVVKAFYSEQLVLEANHKLLRALSNKSNGTFHPIDKLNELVDELNEKEYKIKSYFEFFTESLMQFKWLLYVLIASLGIEWYIRKWYGTI